MAIDKRQRTSAFRDVRGGVRLALDGVHGVTRIVEAMHQRIAGLAPPLGRVPEMPTRGITGLVYRGIHGTTRLVGGTLDVALAGAQALLDDVPSDGVARDALVSALNGMLGDQLAHSGNALAIDMALLPASEPKPDVIVLLHGLCMNDRQWTHEGHDHGLALAQAQDACPVYLRYNSGRHISANGLELATELEHLRAAWPVPLRSITLVGHSVGGLVARSAVHQAQQAGLAWPGLLRAMAFLGSPHHGAGLERGGNRLHQALGLSPYLAPFTRLSGLRSEGITDLRHGNLLEADWSPGRFTQRDGRTPVPLPEGVPCYAVAGTLRGRTGAALLGDGLVTVDSALGRHAQPTRRLRFPPAHTFVAAGVGHIGLLSSPAVYRKLASWLG